MNRTLTGFLNIIGMLILLAWGPAASAASWSSTICNPPPTYGPYNISGGTKYYCPLAGSFVGITTLTGAIASTIQQCKTASCVAVIDDITLVVSDNLPNTAIQCVVPGTQTCTGKGCGGSPNSSGNAFLQLIGQNSITSGVNPKACTREGKNGPIKCQNTNTITGLEGNPAAAALYCPNDSWVIRKQLWLRANVKNIVKQYDSNGVLLSESETNLFCQLRDPQGRYPGDDAYSPDMNTPTNNSYECN